MDESSAYSCAGLTHPSLMSCSECFDLIKASSKQLSKLVTASESVRSRRDSLAALTLCVPMTSEVVLQSRVQPKSSGVAKNETVGLNLPHGLPSWRSVEPSSNSSSRMLIDELHGRDVAARLVRHAFAKRTESVVNDQRYCDQSFAAVVEKLLGSVGNAASPKSIDVVCSEEQISVSEGTAASVAATSSASKYLVVSECYKLWCSRLGIKCQRSVAKLLHAVELLAMDSDDEDDCRKLDLSSVRLGRAGFLPLLLAMRDCPLEKLGKLVLANCALDDDGVTALLLLCESSLPNVSTIDLRGNEMIQFKGGIAVQRFVARRMLHDPSRGSTTTMAAKRDLRIELDGTSIRPSTMRSIAQMLDMEAGMGDKSKPMV